MSVLCESCAGITVEALRQPEGYRHLSNARNLVISAKSCPLCALIRKAQDQDITGPRSEEKITEYLLPEPILLHGHLSKTPSRPQSSLVGVEAYLPVEGGEDVARLIIHAQSGSAASRRGDLTGRPPLDDAGTDEAIDLVKTWFQDCIDNHVDCEATFTGRRGSAETPELPTRVIDVGARNDATLRPRLFISSGTRAHYATLSHCWGRAKFITTVKSTIAEHCDHIRFEKLTKTFQDAVTITRRLGLRYLWIDSLCIVQDDAGDWRRESVKMGRIYRDAQITIAASGSPDGNGGCFIPRPPQPASVQLPYVEGDGRLPNESISFSLYPDQVDGGLEQTALGERAWITQEWMLSARIIHYTAARMVWSCKTMVQSENGEIIPQMDEQRLLSSARRYRELKAGPLGADESAEVIGFFADWCDLVSTYTYRKLTFEMDKPIAILGLANEIAQGVDDHYTAGFFHCEPAIPQKTELDGASAKTRMQALALQLFWYAKDALTRPPKLEPQPSWSWTSTMGAVAFHSPVRTADPVMAEIAISEVEKAHDTDEALQYPNTTVALLCVTAPIKAIPKHHFSIKPGMAQSIQEELSRLYSFFSAATFTTGAAGVPQRIFFLYKDTRRKDPMGWCSFDNGILPDDEILAVAISQNRTSGKFDGFNVLLLRDTKAGNSTEGAQSLFRIGVGEILDQAWFDGIRHAKLNIS